MARESVRAKRVVVVSNPVSGRNRRDLPRIERDLACYPRVRHYVTRSPEAVEQLVSELWREDPAALVINGGDGTAATLFGLVLRHWPVEQRPVLIVLPGGTANMTAGDLGLGGSHRRALRRLYRWLESGCPMQGEMVQRYVMRVESASDTTAHYGMFLGAGVIIQGTEYAHDAVHSRGIRGEMGLGFTLLRTLWGLVRGDPQFLGAVNAGLVLEESVSADTGPAEPGRIERDGHEVVALAVSTLERLFVGIRPFWAPRGAPLAITIIRSRASRFIRTLVSILRGRPSAHAIARNGYESFRAGTIRLWLDGGLNLDGQLLWVSRRDGPVRIVAEGPLHFLRLP